MYKVFTFLGSAILASCLTACGINASSPTATAAVSEVPDEAPPYTMDDPPIPKATCRETDQVETGLQGQIPAADRQSGRAAMPYYCNLDHIGGFGAAAWATLDTFQLPPAAAGGAPGRLCAYYGVDVTNGGTQPIMITDVPGAPVSASIAITPGEIMSTGAMADPWESLRVHSKRKLLAADSTWNRFLDIYNLSTDCLAPVLISTGVYGSAKGHEGWFSADGNTYYMASLNAGSAGPQSTSPSDALGGGTSPVDISDPAAPKQVAFYGTSTGFPFGLHGAWNSDDDSRSYLCKSSGTLLKLNEDGTPNPTFYSANNPYGVEVGPTNGLLIVDNTGVRDRGKSWAPPRDADNPDSDQIPWKIISFTPTPENSACQATYRVSYKGHPYVIIYGEAPARGCGTTDPGGVLTTSAIPQIIDIGDEQHPKVVSRLIMEVQHKSACDKVNTQLEGNWGFTYSTHHCSPDRLHDPTILACGTFTSGLRVFDIRDPAKPKELAYYNVSQVAPSAGIQNIGTIPRPVILTERREIYFTNEKTGFHAVRFAEGVWPFPETPKCPAESDYYFNQYNPGLGCN